MTGENSTKSSSVVSTTPLMQHRNRGAHRNLSSLSSDGMDAMTSKLGAIAAIPVSAVDFSRTCSTSVC